MKRNLSKFRIGDSVRWRNNSRHRLMTRIQSIETGTIVWVEDIQQTGPTRRVIVEFPSGITSAEFDYEFVRLAH